MSESGTYPEQTIEMLKQVTTGMLVDALGLAGVRGGVPGVRPVRGFEAHKIVGPATTVRFAHPDEAVPNLNNFRAIRQSAAGSVLVIDGQGLDAHFTGDNQGECAKRQGLAAVVVYGGARDITGYREIGMPLYCTGPAVRRPVDLQCAAFNVSLDLGGAVVQPGDVIVADEDGVVAIPATLVDSILAHLRTVTEVEVAMEQAIKRDAPVDLIATIAARKQ